MNIPIDVIAIFDNQGNITPSYVRLENENHRLLNHKITEIRLREEHNFAGLPSIDFLCCLDDGRIINLSFFVDSHKWVIKPN